MTTFQTQNLQGNQMSYLKDFQTHITNHDYPGFLRLWEEYCSGDEVDPEELCLILSAVKASTFADSFGRHVDRILPLWAKLADGKGSHEVLKLILDVQTTNSPQFADLAYDQIQKRYGATKHFNEKIRMVGLRNRDQFQGAISNFELLNHMEKGKYVFHTGGWGAGEIVDVSLVREQLSIEFDLVPGKKDLSFANAFKTLIPIPDDHFLAMRFGRPDDLEEKAREYPVEVIRMLLRDLGPKTAAEIKDELCDLVIPAAEWTRWWQTARAKVKKDTMIETPDDIRDPFQVRRREVTHEEKLQKILENKPNVETFIHTVYSYIKDFSDTLKNSEFKASLTAKITEMLSFQEITDAQELQLHFFLEDLSGEKEYATTSELIKRFTDIEAIVHAIEIVSFKKRALAKARQLRPDWREIFLSLLFKMQQAPLRDYLLSELAATEKGDELKKKIDTLRSHPAGTPEAFLWYFQKVVSNSSLPFANKEGRPKFFEALLILLHKVESNPEQKDLVKKIHAILSGDRYAVVRQIMQEASVEEVKEFLLLATKCHSLGDHDIKILHSLAEVAHPAIAKKSRKKAAASEEEDEQAIWTTPEGYQKLQARIQQIATVETVENAKEIEVARAHGDLRENAEFKAALEKRSRLQSELKFLSDQLNRCRIITKDDIATEQVGIGSVIECKNKQGQKVSYTLLGPWDADPDRGILSFQSKLAQSMKGLSIGEKFQFQDDELTIASIRSYLEKR